MFPYLNYSQNMYNYPLNCYQQVPYHISPINQGFYLMLNPVSGMDNYSVINNPGLSGSAATQCSSFESQKD